MDVRRTKAPTSTRENTDFFIRSAGSENLFRRWRVHLPLRHKLLCGRCLLSSLSLQKSYIRDTHPLPKRRYRFQISTDVSCLMSAATVNLLINESQPLILCAFNPPMVIFVKTEDIGNKAFHKSRCGSDETAFPYHLAIVQWRVRVQWSTWLVGYTDVESWSRKLSSVPDRFKFQNLLLQ